MSPDVFIETLEKNGDIHTLGRFVLEEGCRTLQEWSENKDFKHLRLALNVSPLQVKTLSFLEHLKECLSKYSFEIEKLKIEITESIPLESPISHQILREISDLGICIALDDFGTKNSSLKVLLDYPIAEIKIDKDFISSAKNPITDCSHAKQIVYSINDISNTMGCSVLAEGVESFCQLKVLLDMGINRFQGFFFSEPLPKEKFEALIKENGYSYNIGFLF